MGTFHSSFLRSRRHCPCFQSTLNACQARPPARPRPRLGVRLTTHGAGRGREGEGYNQIRRVGTCIEEILGFFILRLQSPIQAKMKKRKPLHYVSIEATHIFGCSHCPT